MFSRGRFYFPMRIDIFSQLGTGHRLLATARSVFNVMRVQPYLKVYVIQFRNGSTSNVLRFFTCRRPYISSNKKIGLNAIRLPSVHWTNSKVAQHIKYVLLRDTYMSVTYL